MRRLGFPVLLALLAACTVTTTGAPCTSDLNCPSDQGCGSDGACSTAALSCPGHTQSGQCRPGTSCASGQIVTCSAGPGVCSTGPVAADCPAHQECASSGAGASCVCTPTRCGPTTPSHCSPSGQVVACAQDTSTPEGCWYEASTTSCGDPGTTCLEVGGAATCACPTSGACIQLDATRCSETGDQLLRCLPVVPGSACLAWQPATNCAAGGLVCSGSVCTCPANPGPTFVADAVGGSPGGAAPRPTGLLSPVACRYRTLTEALAAANARGAGSSVMAAGWSSAVPDGVVPFSEPGGLSIGAGVTLGTDDATPTTAHYAVSTAATLTGPLVSIGPGGAMSGFEIRNVESSGDGVRTACPASADSLPVTLSTIRIVAASSGTPVARLASGVGVSGYCGATMTDVIVDGAATGILVNSVAPGVESAATSLRVTGSTVAGVAVVEGKLTFSGGAVEANAAGVLVGTTGTGAPTFSATGTTFSGNSGDGIYVARGTVFTDACPYVNNGTHVHAQPTGGAVVSLTVQNSSGAAKMTGATNSAFRLLAMGSGSTLVMTGNSVTENDATQSYNVSTGPRRGGGAVATAPFPGTSLVRGNQFFGNRWDQILVAAGTGSIDLSGGAACGNGSNSYGCYDTLNPGVGVFSNGASVSADWNHWTVQPGVYGIDVGGAGVTGFDTQACTASILVCP